MLRERKKRETREAIAETALELFIQRGFDGTTVDEIAEAAAVSRRTVFRYFETKEALLFASQELRLAHFRELLSRREWGESALACVRRACLDMAALYVEERETILALHRIVESSSTLIAYDQRFDAAWEGAVLDALLAGVPESNAARHREARWVAGALVGVVRVTLRDWVRGGGQGALLELGAEALGFLRFKGWE